MALRPPTIRRGITIVGIGILGGNLLFVVGGVLDSMLGNVLCAGSVVFTGLCVLHGTREALLAQRVARAEEEATRPRRGA